MLTITERQIFVTVQLHRIGSCRYQSGFYLVRTHHAQLPEIELKQKSVAILLLRHSRRRFSSTRSSTVASNCEGEMSKAWLASSYPATLVTVAGVAGIP